MQAWPPGLTCNDGKAVPEPLAEFDALWNERAGELARLALAMGIERSATGDVVHDVYLTARKKQPPGLADDALWKWLVRVTVNRCHLEHRRTARWRTAWQRLVRRENGRATADLEPAIDRNEHRLIVRETLKQLDPKLKTVLVLRYFADFNSKEIAEILGLADSTVRGHLRTARERLAAELGKAGYCHE